MQHIPDNEFDRLFKDQLMEAEVQALEGLWERIAPQIAPKKKRNTGLYWSAAATVLIALSAGLLFKPQEKIALHAPAVEQPTVSSSTQSPVSDSKAEMEEEYVDISAGLGSSMDDHSFEEDVVTSPVASPVTEEKSLLALQPSDHENHHDVSLEVEEPKLAATRMESNAVTETIVANNTAIDDDPASTTALEEPTNQHSQSRPRIRNAGDLVNFVVDKLDKREQKFVEFRTDEDETSSLVAINIGPLKINQRRNNK